MRLAYTPRHFILQEFLPRHVYESLKGDDWRGWLMMDERQLRTSDQVRDRFGPVVINTWHTNPSGRNESGLRVPGLATYKPTSQHSFGRACDYLLLDPSWTAEKARQYILEHPDEFPHITRLERGVSWLHADCGNAERIALVDP